MADDPPKHPSPGHHVLRKLDPDNVTRGTKVLILKKPSDIGSRLKVNVMSVVGFLEDVQGNAIALHLVCYPHGLSMPGEFRYATKGGAPIPGMIPQPDGRFEDLYVILDPGLQLAFWSMWHSILLLPSNRDECYKALVDAVLQ